MHLHTKFEIKAWDEKPYRELEGGAKFSRADVTLRAASGELDAEASMESLLYYLPDGTSSFVALLHIVGRLNDRQGSLVLRGHGTYDGETARMELETVPGAATGELEGLVGKAVSVSTHSDYPYMPLTLDYEIS
ncbi:MAG TPA: DUF3224 domain-containing protein [Actinopolymorphaceae bacterium]